MFKALFARQHSMAAFQVFLIVLAFFTFGGWIATGGRPELLWLCRVGAPLLGIVIAWKLFRLSRQPEKLPDLLGELTARSYFERDGLCFAARPELAADGRTCLLAIYFQNRNAGHASTQVIMRAAGGTFLFRAPKLAPISAAIECPGGAFGVWRVPYPVPAQYQGKSFKFLVAAATKYRTGRGELLRRAGGMNVSTPRELGGGFRFLELLAGLFLGFIRISSPASVTFALPANVTSDADEPPTNPHQEILWTPDLATGGFPVMPTRKAA